MLSLVPCASLQHLRPPCHNLWSSIIWWIVYLWTLWRVDMAPSDWLVWPEIEVPTMTSHLGPKVMSSLPLVGNLTRFQVTWWHHVQVPSSHQAFNGSGQVFAQSRPAVLRSQTSHPSESGQYWTTKLTHQHVRRHLGIEIRKQPWNS